MDRASCFGAKSKPGSAGTEGQHLFDVESVEAHAFRDFGRVAHQLQVAKAKVTEDLGAEPVRSAMPPLEFCLADTVCRRVHGSGAFRQVVDGTPRVVSTFEVDKRTPVHFPEFAQGEVEGFAATECWGVQQVEPRLAGMHPDRDRVVLAPFPTGQREVLTVSGGLAIRRHGEPSVGRVEFPGPRAFDEGVVGQAVGDEVRDGDNAKPEPVGDVQQFRKPCHGAIGVHDLDDDPGGFESGESRQVNGSLGVSCATQYATAARAQGEDVARTAQLFRASRRVDEGLDGLGPVLGADPRRASLAHQIDADGEGRLERRVVAVDHELELEFVTTVFDEGRANQAASLDRHEVDHLGRGEPRCSHEIAFVFPVFIVHDDDHLSLPDVFDGILDGVEGPAVFSHGAKVAGGMARKAQICTMVLPVVAYGDPVLRKEADDVNQNMEGLSELIANMWETMYKAEGVGLAAPQIGQSIRLFVVDGSPFGEGENGDAGCKDFKRVMINPVLFDETDESDVMEEGCLSIPGVREPVERPVGVKVEYFDENWVLREEALSGIAARIVQHENDHLDGVMIPDYVPVLKKALLQGKLKDIGAGKVPADYAMRFPAKRVRR